MSSSPLIVVAVVTAAVLVRILVSLHPHSGIPCVICTIIPLSPCVLFPFCNFHPHWEPDALLTCWLNEWFVNECIAFSLSGGSELPANELCVLWIVTCELWIEGEGRPPMFGDYEAQRHWIEVTAHLPPSDWSLLVSSLFALRSSLFALLFSPYWAHSIGFVGHSSSAALVLWCSGALLSGVWPGNILQYILSISGYIQSSHLIQFRI